MPDVAREGIECIDKALDGNLYAFSRCFPRGGDVTMLWRQSYGAMARASLVPSQETSRIEMPKNGEFDLYQFIFDADARPDSSLHSFQ